MKEYRGEDIRNVALVSHSGVGKTTLSEAMLYTAGVINRMGTVEQGNTVSDYNPLEVEKGSSINLTLMHVEWKGKKINIIDTPGYMDFVGEPISALRVADIAIIPVSAHDGVGIGTEILSKWIKRAGLIRAFYINHIDKELANYREAVKQIKGVFGAEASILVFPHGEGKELKGLVDVVNGKYYALGGDGRLQPRDKLPAEVEADYANYRQGLIEQIVELDDLLLERYLEGKELTADELLKALREAIARKAIYPIFAGVPTTNIGTSLLLDALVDYFPSPLYRESFPAAKETDSEFNLQLKPTDPTTIFFFKTLSEARLGDISFFRVYSGELQPGTELQNTTKRGSERIGQIFVMQGKERKDVSKLYAGDIGATVKLKISKTGDTLADRSNPLILEPIASPNPVIYMALHVPNKGDEEKVALGLGKLREEDQTFSFYVDNELKQTLVYGQGEVHLEFICKKLKERFGVEVELARPKIPYRETIRKKAEAQGKFKKQTGGRGQYGDCWLRLEPLQRGEGYQFVNKIVGGVIPAKFIPSVEKGVKEAMDNGVIAGYKVVDLRVTLYFGSFHEVDSSDIAFKIAGSMAFKNAFMQAEPYLLEPIYNIEIIVPEDATGDVIGDMTSRRGRVLGMEAQGKWQKINAQVPLAELYKYSTTLRSLTQGRGYYTLEFSHYEDVPKDIAEKIIAESQRSKGAE